MKPTYQQQYNKLTEAYIRNEVNPFANCKCFVGNLLNNNSQWHSCRVFEKTDDRGYPDLSRGEENVDCIYYSVGKRIIIAESDNLYTVKEIIAIENRFLTVFTQNSSLNVWHPCAIKEADEEALFKAFETTLDLLKEIHINKGEIIDDVPIFSKRKLELV